MKRRNILDGKYQCTLCKQYYAPDNFYSDGRKYGGRSSKCKTCHQAWGKMYWKKPEAKLKHSKRAFQRRKAVREKIINHLGGVCVHCGITDIRVLQIDHVNGGGRKEKKGLSGDKFNSLIWNDISSGRYQILCANCNWIKRYENNEG